MSVFDYKKAPLDLLTFDEPAVKRMFRQVASVLNGAMSGKMNAIGEVTLTANAATTTITDSRLTRNSLVLFDPMTSNAAAELYGATMYVTDANRRNGEFVITHANNAQSDRTFKYLVIG